MWLVDGTRYLGLDDGDGAPAPVGAFAGFGDGAELVPAAGRPDAGPDRGEDAVASGGQLPYQLKADAAGGAGHQVGQRGGRSRGHGEEEVRIF